MVCSIRYEGETFVGGRGSGGKVSIRLNIPAELVRKHNIQPHERFYVTLRRI